MTHDYVQAIEVMLENLYDIVEELTDRLLGVIGQSTNDDWQVWVEALESAGLVTAVFGLIFIVCFFILFFQFLMRGPEMFILRIGIPLACAGLLDNDKGVFRVYAQRFTQSMLAVVIQIALAKLGVGLMLQSHVFWGMACMNDVSPSHATIPIRLPHYNRRWRRRGKQRLSQCQTDRHGP